MTELQSHVHILRLHTLYISQSTYINRTGYGPEDFDFSSSLDDTSDSDSDNSLRFNISPITSEEEYCTSESSGNESDVNDHDATESDYSNPSQHSNHDMQLTPSADSTTSPLSTRTTYRLCGDNIDKTVKQRYMRYGIAKPNSIHYFHSYAVADRIDLSGMSETVLPLPSVDAEQLSISLLPSTDDDESISNNFAILVSRVLVANIDYFKLTFDDVVDWHIIHEFSVEMSKKSEVVSIYIAIIVC